MAMSIFITGVDTDVGKTVLTGMLLRHLRESGVRALGLKPICCGGTGDRDLLVELQGGDLDRNQVSPFYFPEPVAPLVAGQIQGKILQLGTIVRAIQRIEERGERVLIEGVGGVCAPLGPGFQVIDLIAALACPAIMVAPNRVGALNLSLMGLQILTARGISVQAVVLMGVHEPDLAARTNGRVLRDMVEGLPVIVIPYLGENARRIEQIKKNVKKCQKALARVLETDRV